MKNNQDLVLPASNSLEENARLWAQHYNNLIQPGHGLFLDFSATPGLKKPCIEMLVGKYGWILEKPFFVRKQEAKCN